MESVRSLFFYFMGNCEIFTVSDTSVYREKSLYIWSSGNLQKMLYLYWCVNGYIFSTCAVGRSKEHPTRLPHSQNLRLRAFASACASAFCSFGSGLLIQCLACIAINGMQTGHWIAAAQVKIFCETDQKVHTKTSLVLRT